jgi:hypothetical protein
MCKALLPALGLILLAGCRNPEIKNEVRYKVLIGATTIPRLGALPVEDSVVVIAGRKIRSVGRRMYVPIPQNSDRIELEGRWIVPAGNSPVAAEEDADLLILKHAPNGIKPVTPDDIGSRLVNGEWKISP